MHIINNYHNISHCTAIVANKAGPTVAIFAGIHGNELSGIQATKNLIYEIQENKKLIQSGKIIIVTHANEEAINKGVRYMKYDLNRIFTQTTQGSDYESNRAIQLMHILSESDILLDLHSTSQPSIPFLITEMKHLSKAKKLGISHMIVGRNNVGDVVSGDTENYMNSLGKIGYTFELGNNNLHGGEKYALQAIYNVLVSTGQIDKSYFSFIGEQKCYVRMYGVYIAQSDNYRYCIDNPHNFMFMKQGTRIGMDGDVPIYAEQSCILIMPTNTKMIRKGCEVFFLGETI